LRADSRGTKGRVRTPSKHLKRLNDCSTPSPIKSSNFQPLISSTPSTSNYLPTTSTSDSDILSETIAYQNNSSESNSSSTSTSSFSKTSILNNIRDGHYERALHTLVNDSSAGHKALLKVACTLMQKEIKKCCKKKCDQHDTINQLEGEMTLDRMSNFTWAGVRDEMEEKMPVTAQMLKTLMVSPTHIKDGVRKGINRSR
jgi:hypothetical protein